MTLRRYRLAFALHLAALVVTAGLAYTGRLRLPRIPHLDLAGHALLFGVLAALADGALGRRTIAGVPAAPALVLFGAGVEELLQGLSPRRTSSVVDFAADVAGIVVLVALARRAPRTDVAGGPVFQIRGTHPRP